MPSQKHLDKRQEYLDKIDIMARTVPFHKLTVRDICKELSISTGTFYHYFPNKVDISVLVFAMMDRHIEETVLPFLTEDESANVELCCVEYARKSAQSGVDNYRFVSQISAALGSKGQVYEGRLLYRAIFEMYSRGLEKGHFNATQPPEVLAKLTLMAIRGIATDWTKNNGDFDLIETTEVFIKLFLKALV